MVLVGRKFFRRKKVCKFCTEKIDAISYRDVRLLQGFVAERGKISSAPPDRCMHTASAPPQPGHQAVAATSLCWPSRHRF